MLFSLFFCLNAEWKATPFVLANGIVLQMIPPVVLGAIVERYGGNWLTAALAMMLFALIWIIGAVGFWYLMKRRRKNIRTTAAFARPSPTDIMKKLVQVVRIILSTT
ncbi:MAG: hypothetical protein AAGU16_09960 [Desulfitobacterium hafniense]